MSKNRAGSYILHHGSDAEFTTPRWDVGDKHRDFGQCFYTTYDAALAKEWAEHHTVSPKVYHYCVSLKSAPTCDLKIKRFEADEEWARFVYNNRYNEVFVRPDYDIIIGPIADNQLTELFATIKERRQTFEEIAPQLRYEKFNRAQRQVCFCTDKALRLLSPVTL